MATQAGGSASIWPNHGSKANSQQHQQDQDFVRDFGLTVVFVRERGKRGARRLDLCDSSVCTSLSLCDTEMFALLSLAFHSSFN